MLHEKHDPPPSFEDARNRRQKVRAAGMDPNYWYAVAQDKNIAPGQIVEVTFWGDSVALYRGEAKAGRAGRLHAVENRCAHRQLPLTVGVIEGDRIVCQYHGWKYNGVGELAEVPHDHFGKGMPRCKLRDYPVKVRYGLVWLFFGDKEKAESVKIPEIPELEGNDPWSCVPIEVTWNAHHSMIIDNVSDFTHEYLHRQYKPFANARLKRCETIGDAVHVAYDTEVGGDKITGLFIDRKSVNTSEMDLAYEYPYQWSNTDDQIKHWLFVLPEGERKTRGFFLFYFKSFKVPFLPVRFPKRLMRGLLKVANKLHINPLLSQDGVAVEAEQEGWQKHWDEPAVEMSPAVNAFQALTVRKWDAYLASERSKHEEKMKKRLLRRQALEAEDAREESGAAAEE